MGADPVRDGRRGAAPVTDDDAKHDPTYFDELLALELELCDREPFHRIGASWQLMLRR